MLRAFTLKKEIVSGRIAVSRLRFLHHLRRTGKERTVTATILGIQPSMADIPVDPFSWEALKSKTTYIVVTGQRVTKTQLKGPKVRVTWVLLFHCNGW